MHEGEEGGLRSHHPDYFLKRVFASLGMFQERLNEKAFPFALLLIQNDEMNPP